MARDPLRYAGSWWLEEDSWQIVPFSQHLKCRCCGSGFIESRSDPSFQVNPDLDPGFWWPIEKNSAEKIYLFWSKIAICLSLVLLKGRPSLEKPSTHKIERPAPQKMKFINIFYFCESFLLFWIPIQGPPWIRIQSTSGSITLWKIMKYVDSPWIHRFLTGVKASLKPA
jgi:hypothetical protein